MSQRANSKNHFGHKPYLKTKLCMKMSYNWRYDHFVIFLPILAKTWLPWQRPLDLCNQKCLLWIGRSRKPPVISNPILAISRRNAFIAILVPKLVAMVMRFCPLCTGVSQMNSTIAQTLSLNQTLYECDAYNWSCSHFCDIFAYFGRKLVAMATSLRHLQSEMSSLDWPTTKTPCYK